MINLDYKKICGELLAQLPQKQREVISRRFGLATNKRPTEGQVSFSGAVEGEARFARAANKGELRFQRETLEAIGKSFGICRERVRQIEKVSLAKMKKKTAVHKEAARMFAKYLKNLGGVREETGLLEELGGKDNQACANFLLSLADDLVRVAESDDYKAFWATGKASLDAAKNFVALVLAKLEETKKLMTVKETAALAGLKKPAAESYLGISKLVQKNKDGLYGLRQWPEVSPKGIKDKIYLLFKKTQKPHHFTEVAKRIEDSLTQTVHNELIRDPRFVLIGRGIYALREWGYVEGDVKDVILNIFARENKPLSRQEILDRVLKQRLIKENTVLMNLSNKKYFQRDNQGNYLRAAEGQPPAGRANVQEA